MSEQFLEQTEAQRLEMFMTKHFSYDDSGISARILDQIAKDGERKIEETKRNPTERNHQKYDQLKAGTPGVKTNNIWNLFNPKTKESHDELLEKLRETEGDLITQQAIPKKYYYWEKPLYSLIKSGTFQKAIKTIGVQETEAYIATIKIFATLIEDFLSKKKNPYKISQEEYEKLENQRDTFTKNLYLTLYDLGVDVAQLDV